MTIDRFARMKEAEKITGKSRATIYRDMEAGTFPQAVKIGQRAIGWRISDLEKWINDRVQASAA